MKKLVITVLLLVVGLSVANAQKKSAYVDPAKMTPEQRMIQSNSKKKNAGRNASVSKKVKRAKKQDRASRKMKQPKQNKKRKPQ